MHHGRARGGVRAAEKEAMESEIIYMQTAALETVYCSVAFGPRYSGTRERSHYVDGPKLGLFTKNDRGTRWRSRDARSQLNGRSTRHGVDRPQYPRNGTSSRPYRRSTFALKRTETFQGHCCSGPCDADPSGIAFTVKVER